MASAGERLRPPQGGGAANAADGASPLRRRSDGRTRRPEPSDCAAGLRLPSYPCQCSLTGARRLLAPPAAAAGGRRGGGGGRGRSDGRGAAAGGRAGPRPGRAARPASPARGGGASPARGGGAPPPPPQPLPPPPARHAPPGPASAAAAPEMRKNPELYSSLQPGGSRGSGRGADKSAGGSSGSTGRSSGGGGGAPPAAPGAAGTTGSYSAPPRAAAAARPAERARLTARPEVLAPVGGWPQLQAAVENGADAVYFGLSDFSARGAWTPHWGGERGGRVCALWAAAAAAGRVEWCDNSACVPCERPSLPGAARAANFTPDELPEVMAFLRRRGVKGYVALNVLVFDEELPTLEARVRQIAAAGVDAVIVQVGASGWGLQGWVLGHGWL
jgi:hypothetical protein